VQRVRVPVHRAWLDVHRVRAQQPVHASGPGQHDDPVVPVDHRALQRDQVHPVRPRDDVEHVVLEVAGDRPLEVSLDDELDRPRPGAEPGVDLACQPLALPAEGHPVRDGGPGRDELGDVHRGPGHPRPAEQLGERVQRLREGLHRIDPLGPVDDPPVTGQPAQRRSVLPGRRLRRGAAQVLGGRRDRVARGPHRTPVRQPDDASVGIRRQPEECLAALHEVVGVLGQLEADQVVAEQPGQQLAQHRRGQRRPSVRPRERDVHEVLEDGPGPGCRVGGRAGQPGGKVELVVLPQHMHRAGPGGDLLPDRPGQVRVDRPVAVPVGVQVGCAHTGVRPAAMVQQPEQPVRSHVVEAPVRGRVGAHQPDPEPPVAGVHRHPARLAERLLRRGADRPDEQLRQVRPGQRGGQPARVKPPPHDAVRVPAGRAVRVQHGLDEAAVVDHDQPHPVASAPACATRME